MEMTKNDKLMSFYTFSSSICRANLNDKLFKVNKMLVGSFKAVSWDEL